LLYVNLFASPHRPEYLASFTKYEFSTGFLRLHSQNFRYKPAQQARVLLSLGWKSIKKDKHSSLFGPFESYEENKVL
jgi:hypothetical protein